MKWICKVCGYVHEGAEPPDICPVCKVTKERFERLPDEREWADEHKVGIAMGLDERVVEGLRALLRTESAEVGIHLAMGRAAQSEGFPEIGEVLHRVAMEEAEHAGKLVEMLGEQIYPVTLKNLKKAVAAEQGATQATADLAQLAKKLGYDSIYETLAEMAREEARHGKALNGMLKRYFR